MAYKCTAQIQLTKQNSICLHYKDWCVYAEV